MRFLDFVFRKAPPPNCLGTILPDKHCSRGQTIGRIASVIFVGMLDRPGEVQCWSSQHYLAAEMNGSITACEFTRCFDARKPIVTNLDTAVICCTHKQDH